MTELSFIHSPFWLILAVLVAGAMVYGLYYYKPKYESPKRHVLAFLRFSSLLILAFLLLRPIVWQEEQVKKAPTLIWLEDASASVWAQSDSAQYLNYQRQKSQLLEKLEEQYQIRSFKFSDRLYTDSLGTSLLSNLDRSLQEARQLFYGQSPAALVLSTDGIANRGRPIELLPSFKEFPSYVLKQGEAEIKPQAQIGQLRYNPKVLLGRTIQVEYDLRAKLMRGKEIKLLLKDKLENILEKRDYLIDGNSWYESALIKISNEQLGIQVYQLELRDKQDSLLDQRRLSYEVQEERIRIGIYSEETHPDIVALSRAFKSDPLVQLAFLSDLNEALNADLILSTSMDDNLVSWLEKNQKPAFFILGQFADSPLLRKMLMAKAPEGEKQYAALNEDFAYFPVSAAQADLFNDFPPLDGLYGPRQPSLKHQVLFYKAFDGLKTSEPLAWLGESNQGRRTAVFLGRGLWRWRIENYRLEQNFEAFDQMVQGITQYLLAQEKRAPLQVEWDETLYAQSPVRVKAKLYDPSGNLINDRRISLELYRSDRKVAEYQFSPYRNLYQLQLKDLEPGSYRYTVKTKLGPEDLAVSASIEVKENNLEKRDLQARHLSLEEFAQSSGGRAFDGLALDSLEEELLDKTVKSQLVSIRNKQEILSRWPLFFVILGLLAIEWFLRKYWGQY